MFENKKQKNIYIIIIGLVLIIIKWGLKGMVSICYAVRVELRANTKKYSTCASRASTDHFF